MGVRNRCGCGPRPPTPPQRTWTAGGSRSCAGSISSTPSGCSNRPSAGPPEDPHPGRGGPLDLADHHRLHPAASGPAPRGRPAASLGETRRTGPADPRAGPPRVSLPPGEDDPSRRGSETGRPGPGERSRVGEDSEPGHRRWLGSALADERCRSRHHRRPRYQLVGSLQEIRSAAMISEAPARLARPLPVALRGLAPRRLVSWSAPPTGVA